MKRKGLPISVCVVNYNGERYLPLSLAMLRRQQGGLREILLVDNGSTDRSLQIAAELFPEVRVLRLAGNRGPAAARNAGFEAAASDCILFIDNDVIPAADCALRLWQALRRRSAALAMARVLYHRHRQLIQFDGADSHYLGLMMLQNVDRPLAGAGESVRALGSLVTSCFLLDRAQWQGGEPFDESFFFNYEDHDFGMRARIMGLEILAVPAARAFHGDGTPGLSLRAGRPYPRQRLYYLIRNRWLIILKNYQVRTCLKLAPALALYELAQLAWLVRKGGMGEWLRAGWWVLGHLPQTRRKRLAVQQLRKMADADLLRAGPLPLTSGIATGRGEKAAKALLDRVFATYWHLLTGRRPDAAAVQPGSPA